MSHLRESLTVAHLSWATSAIHSQLLICPERIVHSRSFVLSDERIPNPAEEMASQADNLWFVRNQCHHSAVAAVK